MKELFCMESSINTNRIIRACVFPLAGVLLLTILGAISANISFVGCCAIVFFIAKLVLAGWAGHEIAKLGGEATEGAIGGGLIGVADGVFSLILGVISTVIFSTLGIMASISSNSSLTGVLVRAGIGTATSIFCGIAGIGINAVLMAIAGFVGAMLTSKNKTK